MTCVTGLFSRWISLSHMIWIWSILALSSRVFHLTFFRESWTVPLPRGNRPYSSFYPVHWAGCSLRNNLLCVWLMYSICDCTIVSCGSCINPDLLCHSATFKTKNTVPKSVTLTIHFNGFLRELMVPTYKIRQHLHTVLSGFGVSSFCPPHNVDYLPDDQRT